MSTMLQLTLREKHSQLGPAVQCALHAWQLLDQFAKRFKYASTYGFVFKRCNLQSTVARKTLVIWKLIRRIYTT